MSTGKAALIDMGTNTFHLLLVEINGVGFKTIYKEKIAVKLGQGGISQNQIAPEAQKRAFHTLKHFKNLIDGEHIDQVFAFATSAVRNAENGPEFVAKVKADLDIHINVIRCALDPVGTGFPVAIAAIGELPEGRLIPVAKGKYTGYITLVTGVPELEAGEQWIIPAIGRDEICRVVIGIEHRITTDFLVDVT